MKVNEEKAKELLAVAGLFKEKAESFNNFLENEKSKDEPNTLRASFHELIAMITEIMDNTSKLIYKTFPDSQ